jgi:hypothetical protein
MDRWNGGLTGGMLFSLVVSQSLGVLVTLS